jgi:hypothetical protein
LIYFRYALPGDFVLLCRIPVARFNTDLEMLTPPIFSRIKETNFYIGTRGDPTNTIFRG